ncbi:MAG: hypothetical protein QM541_13415 [Flavobacterium sp.]|nr:hypothetical protein [Flavobacterium sp.]
MKTFKNTIALVITVVTLIISGCTKRDYTQPIEPIHANGFLVVVPTTYTLSAIKGDTVNLPISYHYINALPQSLKLVILEAKQDNTAGWPLSNYNRIDSLNFTNLNNGLIPGITSVQVGNLAGYYNATVKINTSKFNNKKYYSILWYAIETNGNFDYKISPDLIYIKP